MTRLFGSQLVRLIVAAALTGYLLWLSDPIAIARAAADADPGWLALACGLVLFDRSLMAWRWLTLLRPLTADSPPPLPTVLRVFFVSTFVGTFLPSVGGDAVRAFSLAREEVSTTTAVASVAMDRALGVVSILLLGMVSVAVLRVPAPIGVYAVLALGGAASLVLAAVIFIDPIGDTAGRIASRLPGARLAGLTQRLVVAIRTYRHHHAALGLVLTSSVAVQVLRVLQAWALGRSLGIDASLAVYFVAIPVILLIMLLPVTINGLGTSQAAFLWTFGAAAVPRPEAFALSVLFVALGIVGNVPGALLYAFRPRRRRA